MSSFAIAAPSYESDNGRQWPPRRGSPSSRNSHHYPYNSKGTLASIDLEDLELKGLDVEERMSEPLAPQDPNTRPNHFKSSFHECIFIFTVMMATAATTFLQGVTVINTVVIGRDLKMSSAQITWISASIGLASGSFMLFFGKTADIFGSKIQLLAGMALLGIFSMITAFAPNPIIMNVLCGCLGLGTAIISPPAIGTLFALYPEGRRRNKAAGALGAGNPLGFILGSISSGIATKLFSWRASFIVISAFFFMMTALASWAMPSIPRSGSRRGAAREFDYLGASLIVIGVALFSAGLTEGPDIGWKSGGVVISLFLGVICLGCFVLWENFHSHPLLDLRIWKNKNYTLCVLCTMLGYMSFVTNQFWIPLYMQQVQNLAPLHIAVRMLPQAVAGLLWNYMGQAFMHRLNGRTIMAIGGFAYFGGALLLIFIRPDTSYWKFLFPAMVFTVIGADFQFIVANLYVVKQMPTQSSLAAGVIQTAYRLSVAIGLGITTAVFGSVKNTAHGKANPTFAFERAYLCGVIFAALGLLFIPFMKLGKQGEILRVPSAEMIEGSVQGEEPPRPAGEYRDDAENEAENEVVQLTLSSKESQSSFSSRATAGSVDTYFQRWSWEDSPYWPHRSGRYEGQSHTPNVIYEVCIKCLEERRVILPVKHLDGFEQPPNHANDGAGWV